MNHTAYSSEKVAGETQGEQENIKIVARCDFPPSA
jgi:hypothetical protein